MDRISLLTGWNRCLAATAAVLALLALPAASASAEETGPDLTPTEVHLIADQADVVKGLLRVEDKLTYDAVALRPERAALAKRIRTRNQWVIGVCDAIIAADDRIQVAENRLRDERSLALDPNIESLQKAISSETETVRAKLTALKGKGESITIADMFEMQMLMNRLSQLSEMATSVVSASNSAISSMTRNVKT